MYHPSDSWGAFKDVEWTYPEIKKLDPDGTLTQQVFNALFKEKDQQSNDQHIYQEILEGIKMPVQNPKTGEEDYVDVSLVSKILIDPMYVQDIQQNQKHKVSFSLSGKNQTISLLATCPEVALKEQLDIPLQDFEEMLYSAINEQKDQRLEEVAEFKGALITLLDDFIISERPNRALARVDENYVLKKGIGIIRDLKANQDIGTFETVDYRYNQNQCTVAFEDIILIGRSISDLNEKERFELLYYDLATGMSYSFMTDSRSKVIINNSEAKDALRVDGFLLLTETFDDQHTKYVSISTAEEKKSLLNNLDKDHPLYETNYNEFRQNRMALIEESRNQARKEQMINQFADIDLDF